MNICATILRQLAAQRAKALFKAQGYDENHRAARKDGRIPGNARRELEAETGKPVVSLRNYLKCPESEHLPAGDDDLPF